MIDNLYPESIEESGKYLRQVLQNISNNKLPYNPISYLLWYEYATGQNELLNSDIGSLLKGDNNITFDVILKLFKKYIADSQVLLAEKKTKEFQKILTEMTTYLSESSDHIDSQGNMLGVYVKDMEKATSLDDISEIAQHVILETKSIVESSKTLKVQLDSTKSEIKTMSKELIGIKEAARTDTLTGLLNRRGFDEALDSVLENRTRSEEEPLSVVMVDIDHFKKVNDTFGHLIGDNVLKILGKLLKDNIKDKDIAARFGGEEFILVFPQTNLENAHARSEQIRVSLSQMKWKIKASGKGLGPITISLGIALYKDGEAIESVVKRADDALYHAKNTGRNKTVSEFDLVAQ